ncbi:Protein PS1 [Fusarium oxysporum f. sp. cubense]|uniref:Protein PS1 n=1 Tax=Fusarium oxysporum f. sp. cubense TaxID=61366 RepID=A0A559LUG6_FUSOC|nr:Protein PS1 [Fusarium oxysporum f. sp. cubense]
MDAELSWLGCLTSPEQGVGPGRWQYFQHGAMYWLPNLGAFALSTSINDKYNSLGGPLGSLGFPVHDEEPINTAPGTFFKFQNGKILWRSTPESISVSMNSVYNFSIDQIQCMSTRSRVSDTLFVTASISIFGRDPATVTKELGDHGVGFTYSNMVLENIPLADEEIALFVYMIMNSGDSGVKSKVESMGWDLTTKGAQIAGEKAGDRGGDSWESWVSWCDSCGWNMAWSFTRHSCPGGGQRHWWATR